VVWEHQSCDVPLIFNLVAMQANMDQATMRADGAMCAVRLDTDKAITQKALYNFHKSPDADLPPEHTTIPASVNSAQSITKIQPIANRPKIKSGPPKVPAPPQVVSADSGLITYPAFLFMLEREYYLAWRANRSLALLIFSIDGQQPRQVEVETVDPFMPLHLSHILRIKRKSDILAHYKGQQFALLLPHTTVTGAKIIARRIVKALEASGQSTGQSITCTFGAADVKGDGKTLSMVLMAAEEAKRFGEESGTRIVAYRDVLINKSPEERALHHQQCTLANLNHSVYGSMVEKLKSELSAKQTGVFLAPVLSYFLEHDYRRAVRENQSLCVLTFSFKIEFANKAPQYPFLQKELLGYVAKVKRRTDILAEYNQGTFALLLPDTPISGAKTLAKRMKDVLEQGANVVPNNSIQVKLEFQAADAANGYPNLVFTAI
jgi:two-component system cell cycle response regulator